MLQLVRAFLWLEIHLARKYRFGVLAQIAQFILLLFIFSRLPLSQGEGTWGSGPYVGYVLTGLAYQIFFEGVINGPSSRLSELQLTGQLQMVLSAPYPRWMILLAAGAASALEGILRAALVFCFGLWIFSIPFQSLALLPLAASLVFTFALCACLALLNVSGYLIWPRVNLTTLFSSLLLGLLSGVFVPVEWLPPALQVVANANPLRWGLDLFRQGMGSQQEAGWGGGLSAIFVFVVVAIVSVLLYRRAERLLVTENRYQNF